ncbi:uncharacterized protein EV422DRAFT_398200 [Fimicolochytrium jonesii]|uniref:uncharacterized protein n=1 Tax=Fimicolochytrium jonesii TaxID=1396493 RepID=UPI0022FF0ACD|nr:uncharacterized protein EV422DRAFT_398200 [Fimicolochytrium jonesii]KAI8822432.1 hypothetical protein EV422DRAFT_398200 [Fimicolochytrium jonesii]
MVQGPHPMQKPPRAYAPDVVRLHSSRSGVPLPHLGTLTCLESLPKNMPMERCDEHWASKISDHLRTLRDIDGPAHNDVVSDQLLNATFDKKKPDLIEKTRKSVSNMYKDGILTAEQAKATLPGHAELAEGIQIDIPSHFTKLLAQSTRPFIYRNQNPIISPVPISVPQTSLHLPRQRAKSLQLDRGGNGSHGPAMTPSPLPSRHQ